MYCNPQYAAAEMITALRWNASYWYVRRGCPCGPPFRVPAALCIAVRESAHGTCHPNTCGAPRTFFAVSWISPPQMNSSRMRYTCGAGSKAVCSASATRACSGDALCSLSALRLLCSHVLHQGHPYGRSRHPARPHLARH